MLTDGLTFNFHRREADISTDGLTITPERNLAIDFSIAQLETPLGVTLMDSRRVAINYWVYTEVFLVRLWMATIIAATCLSVGLWRTTKLSSEGKVQ